MSLELVTPDPAELKALALVGVQLDRILGASDKFTAPAVDPPIPGSVIALAYEAAARDPYDFGYALIFSAEDHLRTMLIVMNKGPLPGYALYTLARAAAEALVRAAYLLEVRLAPSERLGRTLNERLDNLDEQRKAGGVDDFYADAVAFLETKATAWGVPVLRSSPRPGGVGVVIGFGARKRSITDLFAEYLADGEFVFRFLSGHAHTKLWAQLPRARAEPIPDDPAVLAVGTDLDMKHFTKTLGALTGLYDKVLTNWFVLAGCPPDIWRMAKEGGRTPPERRSFL